jgi:tetratricopeptide (TPR) repeat protein
MKRIGLACLVVSAAASGAIADTLADCSQGRNSDVRLRACSDIIAAPAYGPNEKALAYRNRGNARADAGASAQAVADFNEAIRLRPNDASGYAGRARAQLALRNVAAAIDDYDAALRLAPTTPATASLYVGRGHARFVKGDLAAAIADFTEAIRLNPNSTSTFNRRGLAYRRSGDLARAIDDYTAAITLNPVYALAYNNRGYVYEAQGRKQDAIAEFQSALLLDPSLIGARDGLARLGIPAALLAETEKHVQEGKALVEQNCSGCHAVGGRGASPNKKAPEFRSLHERHPSLALREPLSRGIAAPHDEMPKFALTGPQIDTVVAYINSLRPATWATRVRPQRRSRRAGHRRCRQGLSYARKICASCHNVLQRGHHQQPRAHVRRSPIRPACPSRRSPCGRVRAIRPCRT